MSFEWTTGTRSGVFCATGSHEYWKYEQRVDSASFAHALMGGQRWILLNAYSPAPAGHVNQIVLWLPSRRFDIDGQPGLWKGPYNLGCEFSTDPAADDCWGLREFGYCLASTEENAALPDCLAGWPEATAIIHRVGFVSTSGPSDEEYRFREGVVTMQSRVEHTGQGLNGTFAGIMRGITGASSSQVLTITNGRFRLRTRTML